MLEKKNYLPYTIFLLIAILAFYQISFFQYPVKYDAIDCFYPWRFYIGECLQNGQLPYWNPYQDLGYPIHADPSSGAWYPMVWLIGFFNGYTIYAIGFEYWIHVFFAGIGFYTLALTLNFKRNYALLAGIAYMLSGFFIGNAQHLPYIISGAWLPFVLHFYFKMVREKTFINSIKAAFFLFLMITGGYPAFTIILFYLLFIFFVIYFIKVYKTESKKELIFFLLRHLLFLIYTVLLSLVLLVSIYQVSPYLSRLGDFNLAQAVFSPFSPQSFISFLLPFATTIHNDYFNSDLSMRNGYFGLLIFLFFLLGIFLKKPLEIKVLFLFGLFSLTAAVGEYLPIREFLFNHIPMMNVFRFPSVFRLFFIIGGIFTAIFFLQKQFEQEIWNKKRMMLGIISFIGFFITLIVIARFKEYLSLVEFVKNNLFTVSTSSKYWQNVAFQSIVQIGFLLVLLLILWKLKEKSKIMIAVLLLTTIDLFVATQLNAPYTLFYDEISAKEASHNTSILPKGFPKQQNISLLESEHLPNIGSPYWKNMNSFQKQISAEGFNSFSFTSYEFLESEYPQLFGAIKQNKVVTLSDSVLSVNELKHFKQDSLFSRNQLFFSPSDYNILKKNSFQKSENDTALLNSYDAAHFSISCSVSNQRLLTLYQKEYKGWNVTINNKKARIFKSNLNFMTVVVPLGKSVIQFEYKNDFLKIAFIISTLCLLLAIVLFFYSLKIRTEKYND